MFEPKLSTAWKVSKYGFFSGPYGHFHCTKNEAFHEAFQETADLVTFMENFIFCTVFLRSAALIIDGKQKILSS